MLRLKVQFRVIINAFLILVTFISKTGDRRMRQTLIWISRGKFLLYTMELLTVVEVDLGVIRCIANFRLPCILETVDYRGKRTKIQSSWG